MKKILPLIMLSLVLILGACSGGSTEKESSSKDTMKDDHLVLAVLSDADSLDPHIATDVPSAVVLTNIVENLVTQDEKGDIVRHGNLNYKEEYNSTTGKILMQKL